MKRHAVKKRASPTRRTVKPPRIKGPIRFTEEAVELWISPSLEWPVKELLGYIAHAEAGGAVAWKRHDETGEHTVYRPLRAEQLTALAALKRRLDRGGGRPSDDDSKDLLSQLLLEIRVDKGRGPVFARLREIARLEAVKPEEDQRIILEMTDKNTVLWRDPDEPDGVQHSGVPRI
ncbi:MAG TPA: hypothetical protein VFR53_00465 [Methylomirabilota bacterium]|nr:hypothetical protein [Methylomirabilota bacterium]